MSRLVHGLVLGICAATVTAGCKDDFSSSVVNDVVVAVQGVFPDTVPHSDSARLAVLVLDPSGTALAGTRIAWESSDSTILAIRQDITPPAGANYPLTEAGLHATAYARRAGDVTITVRVTEGFGQAEVTGLTREITVPERWIAVSAGADHTCGINVDSVAFCWGNFGALGAISAPPHQPVSVAGLDQRKMIAISSGEHFSCAKSVENLLYCWGANIHGEMGNGTLAPQYTAGMAGSGSTFDLFDVGAHHVCATGYVDYEVVCWGEDTFGQVGSSALSTSECDFLRDFVSYIIWGTRTCQVTPQGPVLNGGIDFMTLSSIDAGGGHTCAYSPDTGESLCWGLNNVGQLGVDLTSNSTCFGFEQSWSVSRYLEANGFTLACERVPERVDGGFQAISTGWLEDYQSHSCAIGIEAFCWGSNSHGQLGTTANDAAPCVYDGDPNSDDPYYSVRGSSPCIRSSYNSPPVQTSTRFSVIGAGARSTCALGVADSVAYCWGDNTSGELGRGSVGGIGIQPSQVGGQLRRFIALSVGAHHTCGITYPDGAMYCWGVGGFGRLGSSGGNQAIPTRVSEPAH